MKRYRIDIAGMTCEHCVKTVTDAIEAIDGVEGCTVDLSSNSAEVDIDESKATVARTVKAVTSAGYTVGGFRGLDATPPSQT